MMSEEQNYEELYRAARRECDNLKRKIVRLERDKKYNAVMTQNIERMRDFNSAERELQFLYNQLLLTNCPDMIFVLDKNLCFILGTEAGCDYLGYSSINDIAGKHLGAIFARRFPAEWAQKLEETCALAMEAQARKKRSDKVMDNDGAALRLDINVSPAINAEGACMGAVVVLHDMTEITLLKEKAEQSSSAKSAFLANMSHEIRTPMNAIKGMTDLLMMTTVDDVQEKYLKNISSASATLIKIINDVLDYSKIDAEKMELVPDSYDSLSFINDVVNIMYMKAVEKGVRFVADISPDIPAQMFGDELRLKQVLLNLLNNAIKFTKEGHVHLKIECERVGEEAVRLSFVVSDTGIGIKEEEKSKLFDAFGQLDLLKTRASEGTGLGLVIAQRIVELMGGELNVESRYGEGSVFSFSILQKDEGKGVIVDPSMRCDGMRVLLLGESYDLYIPIFSRLGVEAKCIHSPGALARDEEVAYAHVFYEHAQWEDVVRESRERFGGAGVSAVLSLRESGNMPDAYADCIYEPILITAVAKCLRCGAPGGERAEQAPLMGNFKLKDTNVLIVDDNEINLIVCAEILKHYGVDPDTALSGAEALRMAEGKAYDIIFMDHMMPEMDGLEATRKIRASSAKNKETPIVALTANAIKGMRETYLSGGMDDYISKPIEIEEIERVFLRFVPDKRRAKGNAAP